MELLSAFGIAFFFSFVGTIPPGALNLSIIQLGLNDRIDAAWRMAVAASIMEYPYAWIAIEFQESITRSLDFAVSAHLIGSGVMIVFGIVNLGSSANPSGFSGGFEETGLGRGMLLGILNPLAIPFWIAMTTYIRGQGWIKLSDNLQLHAYLLGISAGTLVLCMLLAYLARKVVASFKTNAFLRKAPACMLILLGIYSLAEYMFG